MIIDDRIALDPRLRRTAENAAIRQGTSLEHYVNEAVAHAVSLDDAREFFASRSLGADLEAARALLRHAPTMPPIPGDEMPEAPPRP